MKSTLLDMAGTLLALAFGLIVLLYGFFVYGSIAFFILFLAFFIVSVAVTKYGYLEKRELGIYEHERSWENVLANGIVPALACLASGFIGPGAYIGGVAAITADKFASEMGVLGGEPIDVFTREKVKKGKSGAVSAFGTIMSFDGALLMGIVSFFVFPGFTLQKVLLVGLIGFLGSAADTLAGVLEERGIGTKATTNLICAVVGTVLGMLLLA